MNYALMQEAVLVIEHGEEPHEDDSAYVDMPIGPDVQVDMKLLAKELDGYDLALIPQEEDEPVMVSPGTLRVWCYALSADRVLA